MRMCILSIIAVLCFSSCSDNSRNYTGTFENINKNNIPREITVRHIRKDKYEINFLDGYIIYEGEKKGNRITAIFKDDLMIAAYGKMPDSTKSFFDFSSDNNKITVTSEKMNGVEIFIRTQE